MWKFAFVFVVFFAAVPVGAHDVVRVAYNADWPPYSYGSGETVRGILPDLMTTLFEERLGIKVVHSGFPWVRAQEVVKSGDFDAMVTFPSDKRLAYAQKSENVVYNLTQRPIVRIGSLAENELLQNFDVEVLKKYRICVMLGDGWSSSFYKQHNIPYKTAKDTQTCLRLVANERMDVFLHTEAAGRHNMRLSGTTEKLNHLSQSMADLPFTLLVSKKMENGQDLLDRFDQAVDEMKASGAYEALISSLNAKFYNVD